MGRKEYLTIEEAAEFLKLPLETVYKYARTRRIPASKVGRYWRFDKEKIFQWRLMNRYTTNQELQIMVVDDEPLFRDLLTTWLRTLGHTVDSVSDGADAMHYLNVQVYDLVFLDLQMPEVNGVEVLKRIRDLGPKTEIVIVTAQFESHLMDEAFRLGTMTVLKKPLSKDDLVQVVKQCQRAKAQY